LAFYDCFKATQQGIPACRLCEFKERQNRRLNARGIDIYGESPRRAYHD
jgi:hypothetical protein